MRRSWPWLAFAILGGLAGTGALPVAALERTVTDCGDTVPGGGPGQLRRLVNEAGDGDVILVPACTITLQGDSDEDANQGGDLDLAKDLTIQGAGPGRTILDGGANDRVFEIQAGRTVGLSGLTIRNGQGGAGGGILSGGTLQLTNVEVAGNQAPQGGGGILLLGPATLSHVTVADNFGTDVGGVWVASPGVSLVNVTISGNHARLLGGGLLVSDTGQATLNNVTITANQAATPEGVGGIGGGLMVFQNATVEMRNTLIAGNSHGTNGSGPDCVVVPTGTLLSHGANLIEQVTASCTISGVTASNLTGVAPGLGPLADNGGPTRTHALLPGSPALEHGDGACAAVDQRRVSRPQGPRCDIGAYERLRVTPGRLEGSRLR